MHRAAAHRAAWAPRTRAPGTTRSTHQRLTRTDRAGIDRAAWNRARRACGRHSRPGSAGRRSAWHCRRPREPCHNIGARRHHRSRRRLAHQIRFCRWTQRTAAAYGAAESLRSRGSGCSGARPRGRAGRSWNGRNHRARPRRTRRGNYGRRQRISRRQRERTHSRRGSGSIRGFGRHGLTRSRKNLTWFRRRRAGTRGNYCSPDGRRTRRSGLPSRQWRA